MGAREDFIRTLEAEQLDFKAVLASLESGTMQLGEKLAGSVEWTDTTQREIGRLKKVIAEHKRLMEQLRAEGGNWSGPKDVISGP